MCSNEKSPFLSVSPIFTRLESFALRSEMVAASIIFCIPPSFIDPFILAVVCANDKLLIINVILCFEYYKANIGTLLNIVHNNTQEVKFWDKWRRESQQSTVHRPQ